MNGIKQDVVVLSADAYSVDDSKGVTVFYLMDSDFSPVDNSDTSCGAKPGKANLPIDVFPFIKRAPAKYTATFVMKADSKGKMALTIADLEYKCDLRLNEFVMEPAQPVTVTNEDKEGKKK